MPTIQELRDDIAVQITNETAEESITPEELGDLMDRMCVFIDERLISGGDTRGATLVTGTKDNYAYGIITNNLRRMTVTAAGRVLIKTETEGTNDLDIAGTGRFTGNLSAAALLLAGSTAHRIGRNVSYGGSAINGTHIGSAGGAGWYTYISDDNKWHYFFGGNTGALFTTENQSTDGSTVKIANAVLELKSTTKAFYPPRMTTAQRDAMSSVQAGAEIYNTTTNKKQVYDGTVWQDCF